MHVLIMVAGTLVLVLFVGWLGLQVRPAPFPVHWLPIDDESAVMVVPFKDGKEDRFVVRFDPKSGQVTWTESMRYPKSDSADKTLWMTRAETYRAVDGFKLSTTGSATWMSDGKPWATFRLEDVRYNVDVSSYVRARGL